MVDFDVRKVVALFKKHFLSLLIVLLFFTTYAYKLWDVHQAQEAEAKLLATERVAVNDLKVAFEKEKASIAVEQAKRDLELQKREFLIGKSEEDLAKRNADLSGRELALEKNAADLNQGRQLLSKEQLAAAADERVQKLMSEFSELGINLNDNHFCMSGEILKRYYTANSKFSEISSLAKANFLVGKYKDFLERNRPRDEWYGCGR